MNARRWEHFAHQADIGIRGVGETRQEAFEQAALALTAVVADLSSVQALDAFEVTCEAPDEEQLLFEWLNLVIYEMATRHMLFSRYDLYVAPPLLRARVWGERIDPARHRIAVEVKGATYHQLSVKRDASGLWIAQCVVDV